mmetsp:Transcript_16922/g.39414  ORF Transcript_16922/g.39414 Transcript_16922/m.39414 type:complete len:130 (+) Transcript_16922:1-390(+)
MRSWGPHFMYNLKAGTGGASHDPSQQQHAADELFGGVIVKGLHSLMRQNYDQSDSAGTTSSHFTLEGLSVVQQEPPCSPREFAVARIEAAATAAAAAEATAEATAVVGFRDAEHDSSFLSMPWLLASCQ